MPRVGVGACVPVRRSVAGAFNFAGFFNGRAGAAFVVGVPGYSKMYTTDVGGTEAVAQYDPIGRITDISGNGNHWTQTVSAKRASASALLYNTGLPAIISTRNVNAGSPGFLEVSLPMLTDTAGYTVVCAGLVPSNNTGVGMFSRLRNSGDTETYSEDMYSNWSQNPSLAFVRGGAWVHEKDVLGVSHYPTHKVVIGEFVRVNRTNYTMYGSNNVLAPSWSGPHAKTASVAYGFTQPFRTFAYDQTGLNPLFATIIVDGLLSDAERGVLYALLKTLENAF